MQVELNLYTLVRNRYSFSYIFQITWELMKMSESAFTKYDIDNMVPYEREAYYELIKAQREEENRKAEQEQKKKKTGKYF